MNILYVTSEAVPFCKTGGLADVAGSLPQALAANGDRVSVILPLYERVKDKWGEQLHFEKWTFVRLAWRSVYCGLFSLERDGVHLRPVAGCGLLVEGQPVRRKAVLRHGAVLRVGERALQLRLFAGVLLKGETPEHTMDAGESM